MLNIVVEILVKYTILDENRYQIYYFFLHTEHLSTILSNRFDCNIIHRFRATF